MTPPPKRYEILYGEELIGEFNECVQNLGKRRNRREWRLVTAYRYRP